LCIEEPYTLENILTGLSKSLTAYTLGERRKQAAILINNIQRHTIKTQLSDKDTAVLETKFGNSTLLIASMCFDINRPIDYDI